MTLWKIGNIYTNRRKWIKQLSSTVSFPSYTNPVFLSLIHFLLLVYIFPIFHCVIFFLHAPCLSQLDPFPSIRVHISYLPVSFLSYSNPVFLSLIHFLLFVYIFPIFHSVISFLHEPCISQGSCRKEMTLWKIGNIYKNRRKWIKLRKTGFV
jgi:hypothetical protein